MGLLLLTLEYKDDELPHRERLLRELEPHRNLLEPTAPYNASLGKITQRRLF